MQNQKAGKLTLNNIIIGVNNKEILVEKLKKDMLEQKNEYKISEYVIIEMEKDEETITYNTTEEFKDVYTEIVLPNTIISFDPFMLEKTIENVLKKQENENSENIENKIMEKEIVYSPLKGEVKLLEEAEDEAFASGALGKGAAVVPVEGKVMAPVDGTIVTLFPTNHAIAIETNSGVEILIHVGLDTVQLDGKYFYPKVKEGDKIKKGDLMLEFDIDEIKKAGYVLTTPIIVTNTDEYLDVLEMKKENVEFGDELITIVK